MLSIAIKPKRLLLHIGLALMGLIDDIKKLVKNSPFKDNKTCKLGRKVPVNTSALNVARYILYIAYACGDCITNLKIQKLLYYAQAWYLVNHNRSLFYNEIKAWQYGPVVPEVYDEYKKFANKPIEDKAAGKGRNNLSCEEKEYLDEFCEAFLRYSATELVAMTHNEDPWKNAYHKGGAGSVISQDEMREYYSKMLDNE